MAWFTHTSSTFSDSTRTNSINTLDTELKAASDTLAALKTGYIQLSTCATVTVEGAGNGTVYAHPLTSGENTWSATVIGRIGAAAYTSFAYGATKAESRDWQFIVPGDAAASTALTVVFYVSTTSSTSYPYAVPMHYMSSSFAVGAAPTGNVAPTTAASSTLAIASGADNSIIKTLTFTSEAVSAGSLVTISLYRDRTDAADTNANGNVILYGGRVAYTRAY